LCAWQRTTMQTQIDSLRAENVQLRNELTSKVDKRCLLTAASDCPRLIRPTLRTHTGSTTSKDSRMHWQRQRSIPTRACDDTPVTAKLTNTVTAAGTALAKSTTSMWHWRPRRHTHARTHARTHTRTHTIPHNTHPLKDCRT
jgi:hypothetical protein